MYKYISHRRGGWGRVGEGGGGWGRVGRVGESGEGGGEWGGWGRVGKLGEDGGPKVYCKTVCLQGKFTRHSVWRRGVTHNQ